MMRRKINSIRSIRSTPTERHRTCSLAEGRKCIDSGRCTRETVFNRMQIRASSSVGWTVHGTTGIGVGASFTEQPAFTITSHTRPFTIVRSLSLSLSLCLSVSLSLCLSLPLTFPFFLPELTAHASSLFPTLTHPSALSLRFCVTAPFFDDHVGYVDPARSPSTRRRSSLSHCRQNRN